MSCIVIVYMNFVACDARGGLSCVICVDLSETCELLLDTVEVS